MDTTQLEHIHSALIGASTIAILTTLDFDTEQVDNPEQVDKLMHLVSNNIATFDTALMLLLRHPEYAHHVAVQMEEDFQNHELAHDALCKLVDGFVEHCPIERLEVEDAVGS